MGALDSKTAKTSGEKVVARAMTERRRFRRVRLALAGRLYIPSTNEEASCTVEDISPGDAALLCDLKHDPEGRAVVYLEGLGRFEGPVLRHKPGGFVVTFTCSTQKREKLADQLTLELNRHLLVEGDMRPHERVEAIMGSFSHFTRSTGEQVRCAVLDLSLTGVTVGCETKPPVGEHILVGHRAGRVALHHPDGIAIEFLGLSASAAQASEKSAAPAPRPQTAAIAGGRA
jgi:hypothetical protein